MINFKKSFKSKSKLYRIKERNFSKEKDINNITSINVGGDNPVDYFEVGQEIVNATGDIIGIIESMTPTSIDFTDNIKVDLTHEQVIHHRKIYYIQKFSYDLTKCMVYLNKMGP